MVVHVELNSWAQAEEHFRDVDQDQGREHYDRDMFNCELALNILEIGTLLHHGHPPKSGGWFGSPIREHHGNAAPLARGPCREEHACSRNVGIRPTPFEPAHRLL